MTFSVEVLEMRKILNIVKNSMPISSNGRKQFVHSKCIISSNNRDKKKHIVEINFSPSKWSRLHVFDWTYCPMKFEIRRNKFKQKIQWQCLFSTSAIWLVGFCYLYWFESNGSFSHFNDHVKCKEQLLSVQYNSYELFVWMLSHFKNEKENLHVVHRFHKNEKQNSNWR